MVLMVDSAAAVTPAVLSAVEGLCGQKPLVWGRYLTDGHGAATPITAAEAAFLAAEGISILLYANNATIASVAGSGEEDAWTAISAAKALGVPGGRLLVADLEYGWPVSQLWIQTWYSAIIAAGYVPGLYGCLAQPYLRMPLSNAVRSGIPCPVMVSASWTASAAQFAAAALPAWAPEFAMPEMAAQVAGWQACGGQAVGGVYVDLGVWGSTLGDLWSGAPAAAQGAPTVTWPSPTPAPSAAPTVTGAVPLRNTNAVQVAWDAMEAALRAAGQIT